MKQKFFSSAVLAIALSSMQAAANAQEPTDSIGNKKTEGSERNVMLNASDANKPREIQIGLPSEDVNVYENGLPAVYSSAVHKLGQKEFKGILNYRTNHFGWQNVDMNVSEGIGKDWLYTAGVYQNFDPGSFDPKSKASTCTPCSLIRSPRTTTISSSRLSRECPT